MKHSNRKSWLWISSIAAILVVGFFAINPLLVKISSHDNVRGDENDVFEMNAPADSVATDSISTDTISSLHK